MTLTRYYRFTDEAAAKAALEPLGRYVPPTTQTDEDGNEVAVEGYYVTAAIGWALDPVGVIFNDDGEYNVETGEVIKEPTPMAGWHVNLAGQFPSELDSFEVTPEKPYRIFA
jgi:hypothetical protein|tara:strand:+ start:1218 stop:1553 length:336 start_codon:yes stop_codon:yes gene_type:complete